MIYRIVYASATGASEPKHMAYMIRLGIWGPGSPFKSFQDFLTAVEKRYSFFLICAVTFALRNISSNHSSLPKIDIRSGTAFTKLHFLLSLLIGPIGCV